MMMISTVFNGVLVALNFLLREVNNIWIPSNVRSLGCYSPFDVERLYTSAYTSTFDEVGFSTCFMCTTSFVLLRGIQCICIEDNKYLNLIRVNDTYCDILCDESVEESNLGIFLCGGNLGGNLYCNKQAGSMCLNATNQTASNIYEDFGIDFEEDFESVKPCLELGCGRPPNVPSNLSYVDYFPNLNPEDCIVYCKYMTTSYAHVGWFRHPSNESNTNEKMYPTCACANDTWPADPNGSSCQSGTCPPPVNPLGEKDLSNTSDQMCGNKDSKHPNWSVYCTTVVLHAVNGTPYCAPYQKDVIEDDSWNTCRALSTATQRISTLFSTVSTENCQSHYYNQSKRINYFQEGMVLECTDRGNCGNNSCLYKGSCYYAESLSSNDVWTNVDVWRNASAEECYKIGGHLVAIETKEEQEFLADILRAASENKYSVLTSGVRINGTQFWSLSGGNQSSFPDVSEWDVEVLDCSLCEECKEECPSYLILSYNTANGSFNVWDFTRCHESYFYICEYPEKTASPLSTTITAAISTISITSTATPLITVSEEYTTNIPITYTSTSTVPPLNPEHNGYNCSCEETDVYHTVWSIEANETLFQPCRVGAIGNASWTCDFVTDFGCKMRASQPDFTNCHSLELKEISNNILVANNSVELLEIWEAMQDFTSSNDTYFGHEIGSILNIVTDLLNRQDEQMGATENHLEFQINTTQIGTFIIHNLVSHDIQWDQITQIERSQSGLLLLNVSEDISFRLADVAEEDGRSLRCETYTVNVTLSSAYWDGNQTKIEDCSLSAYYELDKKREIHVEDIVKSEIFRKFPLLSESSYLLLPSDAIFGRRIHKAAGVLISHLIVEQILPGHYSVKNDKKEVNSALISYTLRNGTANDFSLENRYIPDGKFVQLIFEHGTLAKDPPVRILHRSLESGETPSAVIDSSFCVFLSYNVSNATWIWDDHGCVLQSTNRSHSVCLCSHLTGFSTLMDFHDYTGESRPLEIISIVCSSASTISLAITFVILTVLRSIKTDRTIITQNLCIFLMLSHIMTLTTLDRHYLKLNDITCAVMGVSLHFTLLVSFMWMGVEGLRLCRMVIYVFNLRDWTLYYILAAYTIPIIIVGATVLVAYFTNGIIAAYVGDETCWLNGENYKWTFAGPVVVIILANLVFAAIAVRSSWNLKQNVDRSFEEKVRNAAALSLSLTCLLGISWLTGFFLYAEKLVFAYIFTITNGLQGVMIALFRCLLNDEVRIAIKERWRRHKSNSMGRWSSTMTDRMTSQRNQSLADKDGNLRANKKKGKAERKLSVISNTTKTTNITHAAMDSNAKRRRRDFFRVSGAEISDEISLDNQESFSSSSSMSLRPYSSYKETEISNVVKGLGRVSFIDDDEQIVTHYLQSDAMLTKQEGNLVSDTFDSSAFF